MDLIRLVIVLMLNTISISTKYVDLNDDSIEKIFYYKDFKQRSTDAPTTTTPKPKQKLSLYSQHNFCSSCCHQCCHHDDFPNEMSFNDVRAPESVNKPTNPPKSKRSKIQPINFRRSNTVTKDHIKKLIAHDEDIKKILKDLVRVTMQKIDVIDILKAAKRIKENDKHLSDDDYESILEY